MTSQSASIVDSWLGRRPGRSKQDFAAKSSGRHQAVSRPSTARSRSAVSTFGVENQEIICAISDSRGIAPVVGLSFVNLDTGEAVLSEINDSQMYTKTVHKLAVFNPTFILMASTAANSVSKLFAILRDNLEVIEADIVLINRQYWAESAGLKYIDRFAFSEDLDNIKNAVGVKSRAVCCFAAVLKHVELGLRKIFPYQSLRIKYEAAEGCMVIDVSTIRSLELVQNLTDAKSKACLFRALNETQTPMGRRLLRNTLLQPLTGPEILSVRYDAVEELSKKEDMLFALRSALKHFSDADKTLTQLLLTPAVSSLQATEQAINNIILLKHFIGMPQKVLVSLAGARSSLLRDILALCSSSEVGAVSSLINATISADAMYASKPLEIRNQRTYAVKSGVNGLLDVARQTYKEATEDAMTHISGFVTEHNLQMETKFDNARRFYMRIRQVDLCDRDLPAVCLNIYRKREWLECQTMELLKLNQRVNDSHVEAIAMSDKAVQGLVTDVQQYVSTLYKICEGIALLDMLASFAHLAVNHNYVRPSFNDTLALKSSRHPVRERQQTSSFVANDVYATQQHRFHIVTGCNMSGKSTYIRSIALITIMAQIGSFVPAEYASISIRKQLLARVSVDDSIEANVSTFSAEMREAAFVLKNVDDSSMIIVDELGRGTSSRDGSAIAIAIAEALIESRALVWFATHFRDLATILAERNGVVSYHLAVNNSHADRMEMLYQVSPGVAQDRHYGIKLAKTLPLPPDVLQYAEIVATELARKKEGNRTMTLGIITARKRKMILNLKEHLIQAESSLMNDEDLRDWLTQLREEFVMQMSSLVEEEQKLMGMDIDRVVDQSDSVTETRPESVGLSMNSQSVVYQSIEPTQDVVSTQLKTGLSGTSSYPASSRPYGSVMSDMLIR